MQLTEQYRPNQWSEVVGQDKAVGMLNRLAKRSLAGRAYWIAGPSGTGKSTIARLIAQEVAAPFNIDEVDATDLSAAAVRDLERISHLRGLGEKSGRAFIVNEAHGLNKAAVRQLLTTLEADRVPSHVVWVFTTTDHGAALFDGIDKSSGGEPRSSGMICSSRSCPRNGSCRLPSPITVRSSTRCSTATTPKESCSRMSVRRALAAIANPPTTRTGCAASGEPVRLA